jgi:hypothetical protein
VIYKLGNPLLFLVLFFLFALPNPILGQKHYEEGYVVLNNGDTIIGRIKDRTPDPFGKLYKKIRFKGKGKSKYGPDEILSYKKGDALYEIISLIDGKGFLSQDYSIAFDGRNPVFIRVVERGPVNHYLLEFQDADSGYFDHISYFQKSNGRELVRTTQGIFGLRRKRLASLFHDCPLLVDKILNKELKTSYEVVTFYNTWKKNQKTY